MQSGSGYQGIVDKISGSVRILSTIVNDNIIKSPSSGGFLLDFHTKAGDKLTNRKGNKFYKQ